MKLKKVEIRNFRIFRHEVIYFDDYSCFVGPNGSGKSTVLQALGVFFGDSSAPTATRILTAEDFHHRNTSEPIEIVVTLSDLSPEQEADLSHYVRQGEVRVITRAVWNEGSQTAPVFQFGVRQGIADFSEFFGDAKRKVPELRAIYSAIKERYPDLPGATTKPAMTEGLRRFEEANPALCTDLESSDQFYGVQGAGRLGRFLQWVWVPAIKDAAAEQLESRSTALGQLLARTIRSRLDFNDSLSPIREEAVRAYREVLTEKQEALEEISGSLERRFREWSHSGGDLRLEWHQDDSKVVIPDPTARVLVGERGFQGELARLGHGIQRSFLVAILQELAQTPVAGEPHLILAIEEPELFQHPPQARHFASTIENLANGNVQAIVTTHSPYFVSGRGFEAVRMVRPESRSATVRQLSFEDLSARLAEALGQEPGETRPFVARIEQVLQPALAEMFFAEVPVLVEGLEDVAFISTALHMLGSWDDFRRLGCHFVITGGKSNMSRPVAIAKGLEVPAFVVFDADGSNRTDPNETDNRCLMRLMGYSEVDPFPAATFREADLIVWPEKIARSIVDDVGEANWAVAREAARSDFGLTAEVRGKNAVLIAATLEHLKEMPAPLEDVCARLIAHADTRSRG